MTWPPWKCWSAWASGKERLRHGTTWTNISPPSSPNSKGNNGYAAPATLFWQGNSPNDVISKITYVKKAVASGSKECNSARLIEFCLVSGAFYVALLTVTGDRCNNPCWCNLP